MITRENYNKSADGTVYHDITFRLTPHEEVALKLALLGEIRDIEKHLKMIAPSDQALWIQNRNALSSLYHSLQHR